MTGGRPPNGKKGKEFGGKNEKLRRVSVLMGEEDPNSEFLRAEQEP